MRLQGLAKQAAVFDGNQQSLSIQENPDPPGYFKYPIVQNLLKGSGEGWCYPRQSGQPDLDILET